MKNAILYILASGLVHAGAWYGVLPFVADSLNSEVEEELHKPTVQSAVEPSPVVLVAAVEEETVEPEVEEPEPTPEPEPEIVESAPEPEPEPEVEPDSENDIVEPEPEPEIAEPEPEEEPKPESDPVQEPEEEEDNRMAAASAGGSDAEPAGTTSDSQPPRPAGTGSGAGGGTSTGYGAGDQAKGTPTTQPSRSSTVDRSKMLRAYQLKLARIFQAKKKYPRRARRQGLEGEVVVEVVVDGTGAIVSSRVVKSSGYDGLDEAALEAVTSIGKLPPPPSELDWNQRKLRIPYKYRLS